MQGPTTYSCDGITYLGCRVSLVSISLEIGKIHEIGTMRKRKVIQ